MFIYTRLVLPDTMLHILEYMTIINSKAHKAKRFPKTIKLKYFTNTLQFFDVYSNVIAAKSALKIKPG